MKINLRPAAADDVDHLRWALYTMVTWSAERRAYPFDAVIAHPELVRYYRDWGRPGDLGLVAEAGDEVAGLTFCRLFTAEDHGHGYLDEQAPEVGVAVAEQWRGHGVGTQLMMGIADAARSAGRRRLSLSVDTANPAVRLYQRLGYQEVSRDDGGIRMVLDL